MLFQHTINMYICTLSLPLLIIASFNHNTDWVMRIVKGQSHNLCNFTTARYKLEIDKHYFRVYCLRRELRILARKVIHNLIQFSEGQGRA